MLLHNWETTEMHTCSAITGVGHTKRCIYIIALGLKLKENALVFPFYKRTAMTAFKEKPGFSCIE